jgi:mannitol-1-/sugar-/sorbitol-6-/2-deoxyglucose-6-phosphatase
MSSAARFAAVVFDMDGLLIDSEPLWHEAEIDVFGRYGVPLTVEMCRRTQGNFVGEVAAYWFRQYPWPGPSPDAVAAEVIDAMAGLLEERLALKAGALHVLDFFRQRSMPMALASSSPRRLIDVVVERALPPDTFDVVCSGEDERAGKPDPAVFLTAARLLGVSPDRCVVFEDSPAGVQSAKAAGMTCVAVPEQRWDGDGGSQRDTDGDLALGADAVLRSLEDVDDRWWGLLQLAVADTVPT